jgi:hypothetical protein
MQDARRLQSSWTSVHETGSGSVATGRGGAEVIVAVPTSRSPLRVQPRAASTPAPIMIHDDE